MKPYIIIIVLIFSLTACSDRTDSGVIELKNTEILELTDEVNRLAAENKKLKEDYYHLEEITEEIKKENERLTLSAEELKERFKNTEFNVDTSFYGTEYFVYQDMNIYIDLQLKKNFTIKESIICELFRIEKDGELYVYVKNVFGNDMFEGWIKNTELIEVPTFIQEDNRKIKFSLNGIDEVIGKQYLEIEKNFGKEYVIGLNDYAIEMNYSGKGYTFSVSFADKVVRNISITGVVENSLGIIVGENFLESVENMKGSYSLSEYDQGELSRKRVFELGDDYVIFLVSNDENVTENSTLLRIEVLDFSVLD